MKEKQKQKVATRETINGTVVNSIALSRSGVPQFTSQLGFMTVGRSGSVRYRARKVINNG
jgi:hypothetical protein